MAIKQKISPFLWFEDSAEEAARFYVSLFPNSKVVDATRIEEIPGGTPGKATTVTFQLDGVEFIAFNGGPYFKLTEAVSLWVHCEGQDEVDRLWNAFIADGGAPSQCGWLKDRFGLSWQIIPEVLMKLMADKDRAKGKRVMEAMLKMTKIDVTALKRAYEG